MTENMACGSGRACCPCNKKGYCRNCCCVKNGHFCMSCLPSKLGNCANLPVKQSPSPVPYLTYSASRARSPSPVPAQPSAVSPNHTSPASLLSSHNSVVDLPSFKTVSDPNFVWGVLSGNECISVINRCYSKAVHWTPNLFKVLYGKHGRSFVKEMSRLFRSYSKDSVMEGIALKVVFLLPLLLLQKPHRRSKSKDHVVAIEHRLQLWKDGLFMDLFKEGETIQKKFNSGIRHDKKSDLLNSFTHNMFEGKVRAALRILDESQSKSGQPLSLSNPLSSDGPHVR